MKVIIASNNKGKIREYKDMLEPLGYEVLSQSEAGINLEVPETGSSYKENAFLKANEIYRITKSAVLADDSGISIDFLNGGPGLYSARFKPELTQEEKNSYILNEMKNETNRKASFNCAICFIYESGEKIEVQGICLGEVAKESRGENGFGYDPIFIPEGYNETFAELSEDEKNKISHRGIALKMLREKLLENK